MGKLIKFGIIGLVLLVVGIGIATKMSSFYNRNVELTSSFDQKNKNEMGAKYTEVVKKVKDLRVVQLGSDSLYMQMIREVMGARRDGLKDGQNTSVALKFITESNPTASYKDQLDMSKNLNRVIESGYAEIFNLEKEIQDIVKTQYTYNHKFPNNILASWFDIKDLEYKPITNSRSSKVMETRNDEEGLI